MLRREPTDLPLLLEVFREGLVLGLIPKDDVVAWADSIIDTEDKPAYFFIEISLAKDTNELAEVLDRYVTRTQNPIAPRVIMGLIYQKLIDDNNSMTLEHASDLTGQINNREILTRLEFHSICTFEDYEILYLPDITLLQQEILNFLTVYKEFTLSNCDQWPAINSRVEETLKEKQAKEDKFNDAYRKEKKTEAKRKLKRYAFFSIPVVILLIIVFANWKMMQGQPSFSKTLLDHGSLFFTDVFGAYVILRFSYELWLMKRRRR